MDENKEEKNVEQEIPGESVEGKSEQEQKQPQTQPENDVQKKVICALSYLFGILFFLPLVVYPNDDFAKFHANQSLVVLIVSVIGSVVLGILTIVPAVGIVFSILSGVFGILMLVECILGILNVVHEEKKELPVIGKISIIK